MWLENLNLRGSFKQSIMNYIQDNYPDLVPLYNAIYNKKNRTYFQLLEKKAEHKWLNRTIVYMLIMNCHMDDHQKDIQSLLIILVI